MQGNVYGIILKFAQAAERTRRLYYKTFYSRNLRTVVTS
jgi:hypothetical protein